jgi:hypothetical protein
MIQCHGYLMTCRSVLMLNGYCLSLLCMEMIKEPNTIYSMQSNTKNAEKSTVTSQNKKGMNKYLVTSEHVTASTTVLTK